MARIEYNYPLLSHNTFGIEAYADRFVAYDSVEDLRQVVRRLRADCPDVPVLHIGGGSNLLFLSDFKGVVLHSAIGGIECEEQPCLLYTSPSPRDVEESRMPSSA